MHNTSMARSLQAQYDAIDAACQAIEEGAQEYYIGSRRVRRGELMQLYKQRSELLALINSSSYGIASLGQIERPT